jgi:hypothetical protein
LDDYKSSVKRGKRQYHGYLDRRSDSRFVIRYDLFALFVGHCHIIQAKQTGFNYSTYVDMYCQRKQKRWEKRDNLLYRETRFDEIDVHRS